MLFITTGRLFRATITMLRFTVVEVWVVLNSRLNRSLGRLILCWILFMVSPARNIEYISPGNNSWRLCISWESLVPN